MYKFILLVFLAPAYAQIILPGSCGNETINTESFNQTALATWQEVQRIPNQLEMGQCSSVSLRGSANSNSSYVLSIREVVNRTVRYQNGSITTYSNTRVTVNFTGVVLFLRVLKTDSTNYALIYGCRNVANNTKEVYGWKMSRSTTLSSSDIANINSAINGTELQNVTWSTIFHSAEACKVNSAVTSHLSILLCFVVVIVALAK